MAASTGRTTALGRHGQCPQWAVSNRLDFRHSQNAAGRHSVKRGSLPTFAAPAHEIDAKPEGERRQCGLSCHSLRTREPGWRCRGGHFLGGKCECAAAANGPGPVDGSLLPHGAQFGLSPASPHDCIDPFFISIRVSDAAPAYSNCQPFSDGRQDRCPKIGYRQSEKLRQFMSSQPDRLSFARDIQFLIRTVVTPEELWSKATSKSASGRARDRGACGRALS
jgi:hypothetical protein